MAVERIRIYAPKGGMCASCINFSADCSHLDFSIMPVIEKTEHSVIVKCQLFARRMEQELNALEEER